MANTHTQPTTPTPRNYRPGRPTFTIAEIVQCLLDESAQRMAEGDAVKSWALLEAARRIGDQEGEG